jgi:hypothetical protein
LPALELIVDTVSKRIVGDAMSSLVCGSIPDIYGRAVDGWSKLDNTYVEPISKTLMLAPMVTLPAWSTSTSGLHARTRKTDFTLTETAKWKEEQVKLAGDYYLMGEGLGANSGGVSVTTFAKNRGWYVGFHVYSPGDADQVELEVGWGSSVGDTASVSLKFWAFGKVDIYKGGVLVDTGTYSGSRGSANQAGQFVQILLIPCRFRELLIVGLSAGDGHKTVFEDIADTDSSPTIVAASNFWFRKPNGATCRVQLAPLKFPTSGSAIGAKTVWKRAPQTGEAVSTSYLRDVPFYGTSATGAEFLDSTGAAWVSNGTRKSGNIRVNLTGDGTATDFVHFATATVSPRLASTPNSAKSLVNFTRKLSMVFDESLQSTKFTAEIVDPSEAQSSLPVPALLTQSNRPFEIKEGTALIAKLTSLPMKSSLEANSEAEVARFEALPEIVRKLLDTRIDDPYPGDGLLIENFFNYVCSACGLESSEYYCSPSGFTLEFGGSPSEGEFGTQVQAGASGFETLSQLHQDLCATWFFGLELSATGLRLALLSPSEMESTPAIDMYLDEATATADSKPNNVFYEWERGTIEAEANDIWVTGFDPRTRRPIVVHKADTASQAPTTAVGSRPGNWIGGIRKYGLQQRQFTSVAVCTRSAEILYDRLTPAKAIRTAEGIAMKDGSGVYIARGRMIRVWEESAWVKYRVISARIESFSEHSDFGSPHRRGFYVLERHVDGRPSGGYLGIQIGRMDQILGGLRIGERKFPTVIRQGSMGLLQGLPPTVVDI